jgi:hypothetical protein
MGSFRRVEAEQAGPAALGILIPPGRRTFVILRPRSLPWDLLVCRGEADPSFAQLTHDEASACAQGLFRALREWADDGRGVVEMIHTPEGFTLRVVVGGFALAVCPRVPGRPYAALVCSEVEAHEAASRLYDVLRPAGSAEQEVYFNTRFFER